mgnify:CR=1 FL=1|jgi:hypothetical protein|uniref:Uncharacterized protein n=1 Tax=viral metagenome TaxID=1070528 RepID=A0A6C0IPI5_9ZZZZ
MMNLFGKDNNDKTDDYTLIHELMPNLSIKWYQESWFKIGTVLCITCGLILIFIFFQNN